MVEEAPGRVPVCPLHKNAFAATGACIGCASGYASSDHALCQTG